MNFDLLIRNATIVNGSGSEPFEKDVYIKDGKIARLSTSSLPVETIQVKETIDANGLHLAPGFIDVHTHDDINVIDNPEMLSKISQGVTTVIVGNCGISASPVVLSSEPPDPLNLLGSKEHFKYPNFASYSQAVELASPHTNVAALIGHTTLRASTMDDLFRAANADEIESMQRLLGQSLAQGAIGFSSGLAYATANQAPTSEMFRLMETLANYNAVYATHLRSEFDTITNALKEAFETADHAKVPLIISHLKCAGTNNWGRSKEILELIEESAQKQEIACDCYPYSASSSTLDLSQVTSDSDIFITWSTPSPESAGRMLTDIAHEWGLTLLDTAAKLQPAGAVYHCMDEKDVKNILSYKRTMVGSDGLPCDPHPHPRLWGTFPRFIGHYCRDLKLLELSEAIHKITGLAATQFKLQNRGIIAPGNWADLVLFDLDKITDTATFSDPKQLADGVHKVWVNGELSYTDKRSVGHGNGQFLYGNNL